MKISTLFGTAAVLLTAHTTTASDAHRRLHGHSRLHELEKKHAHLHVRETQESTPEKRSGQCAFPTDDPNLVAVTPGSKNAGWALSPDVACKPGMYCPIACKPGMVMAQWEPGSTYNYPESMNGGLFCDKSGNIKKPFPNKPNCVDGTGTVKAVNKCGKKMSFCQTVLPGLEDMIIPTLVSDSATLAVPGPSYWGSTAAHFYVNPPGTEEKDCIWGDENSPIGNWSPYVAGTNTDSQGLTYVKLGLNPIWIDSPLKGNKPDFGLRIECPGGGCNGLPCEIDVSGGSPKVKGLTADTGAGGANFCVVTVPKGKTANVVAYNADGSSSGGGDSDDSEEEEKPSPKPKPKPKPKPSPKPEPEPEPVVETTSEEPEPEPTSVYTPPPPPPEPTTTEEPTTEPETTEEPTTSTEEPTTSSTQERPSYKPGVFRENGTDADPTPTFIESSISSTSKPVESTTGSSDDSTDDTPETTDEDNQAGRKQGNAPLAGLVVAFAAAACFF